jgi:hypothetical protein
MQRAILKSLLEEIEDIGRKLGTDGRWTHRGKKALDLVCGNCEI